jgi:hypothetical protein
MKESEKIPENNLPQVLYHYEKLIRFVKKLIFTILTLDLAESDQH